MLSVLTPHTYSIELGSPKAWNRDQPAVWALPSSVPAGFPSPADDHRGQRIDVFAQLVKHPQATYAMRVRGDSMRDDGISDGDVILVDRAVRPRSGQVVVAVIDGEFTCKRLWMRNGHLKLKAANPTFPDIVPGDGQQVEVWGVVIAAVKQFSP